MKRIKSNSTVKDYLLSLIASSGLFITSGFLLSITPPIVAQTLIAQNLGEIYPDEITVRDIKGFAGVIQTIAISPDGKNLFVGTGANTLNRVDLRKEEIVYSQLVVLKGNSRIAVSPDGKTLALTENIRIGIFDTKKGERLKTLPGHPQQISDIAISPDGKKLVSVSGATRDIRIWDFKQGKLADTLTEDIGAVRCVDFTPDGELFITGSIGNERIIQFWNAKSLELIQTSPPQAGYINDLAVSSDGKLVVAVRNYIKVWDLNDGLELHNLKGPNLEINALAISPDGRYVATANKEGTVMIFDITNGQKVATLQGHKGWVRAVAFSPDGKYLFSGAEDKVIKVWQLQPDL